MPITCLIIWQSPHFLDVVLAAAGLSISQASISREYAFASAPARTVPCVAQHSGVILPSRIGLTGKEQRGQMESHSRARWLRMSSALRGMLSSRASHCGWISSAAQCSSFCLTLASFSFCTASSSSFYTAASGLSMPRCRCGQAVFPPQGPEPAN